MTVSLYISLIVILGLVHILSDYYEKWSLTYLFKPLTMLFILALVWFKADMELAYSRWIICGLFLSLIGDIFLMLRPQRFIEGLVSFLLAHIAYIFAFYDSVKGNNISWLAFSLLPFGLIYLAYLWKHLGKYRFPVLSYFITIGLMLFFASALFIVEMSSMAKFALAGAILFAISDGVLAFRKFVKPLAFGQFYVMITYVAAQTLIALSAVYYWN